MIHKTISHSLLEFSSLSHQALQTASEVVRNLPLLSLANESQITALGSTCLAEVTSFLCKTVLPQSGADPVGL